MTYSLYIEENLDKVFQKLSKKDKKTFEALQKKIQEILENPLRYKPLRAPLQNMRRVHIASSFVLIFKVDELQKIVQLIEFEHHDQAYK